MPGRINKLEIVFFLTLTVTVVAYIQTFLDFPALNTGLVFTMPLMVAFTIRYGVWGVVSAALGVTLGAGLLRGDNFIVSGLMGLGAVHGLVLTKLAYRHLAPRYGIDVLGWDILGISSKLKNRLFFAGFGALAPVVVTAMFIFGMERKINVISSVEYILHMTGVIGWGFAATVLLAPVILVYLLKGKTS